MAKILGINFGSPYPTTQKYEQQQQQLIVDKKRYTEYSESIIYQRFLELDKVVHTGDFEKRVSKLKNEKFQDTDAYHKYKSFLELKNSKDIKTFLKFIQSGKERLLGEYQISAIFLEYEELTQTVNSSEFKKLKSIKGFKKTDEYKQLKQYNRVRKSKEVKFILKTIKSSDYRVYNSIKDSSRLEEFMRLEIYVNTDEFKELKSFLEDKKRFYKSEEYKLLHEFEEIKKSEDLKWFEKTKSLNPFTELDKWQLTFEDDFDQKNIDPSKWMTGYYWGKALMNDNYVLAHEQQYFRDKNIEIRDSSIRINTLKEKCQGKKWDIEKGFVISDFEYTSGIIGTGHSFRQQYGKFEIKVKLKTAKSINHAFWMLGEKMTPQITIFKTGLKNSKKILAGTITQNGSKTNDYTKTVSGVSLANDYHILTFEWSKNSLVWKINGVKINEQTNNIPQTPMYLIFSTHITNKIKEQSVPRFMEIDWVKCYQLQQ